MSGRDYNCRLAGETEWHKQVGFRPHYAARRYVEVNGLLDEYAEDTVTVEVEGHGRYAVWTCVEVTYEVREV